MTPAASRSILRHITRNYGDLPGVWVGFLASAAAYVLLYGALAVAVTEFLLAALSSSSTDPWLLAARTFSILAASGTLALVGNYAFVRSTDLRYATLVGQYYSSIALSRPGKINAERLDRVKNLFRDHMDGTIGVLRILRDDVLRILLACVVPAVYLATYDLLVGALVGLIAAVQAWVALGASRRVAALRKSALATYHRLTARMFDALRNAGLLRIAASTAAKREELEGLASEEAALFWRRHRTFFVFEYAKILLTATCFALVFWITGSRYAATSEAAYLVVLSAMYLLQAMHSASSSADVAPRLQEKWSSVSESLTLLERLSDAHRDGAQTISGAATVSTEQGVRVEGLTFAYPDSQAPLTLFQNASISIPRGAHVALVGANGSGKSTLLRIILGLEETRTGRAMVEGLVLGDLVDSERAKLVSWLPPGGPVIDGSIEENLRLFEPGATDDAVRKAIDLSGLRETMDKFPAGLASPVGDGGSALSDGQRARLALARCLLRDAHVYLLDEPTAAIDADSAARILGAVLSSLSGRTVLAVIHSDLLLDKFPYVLRCANRSLEWVRRPTKPD